MPGVNVTTAVRTGPVGTTDVVAGQVFMVGETERGPTDEPTLLRSFNDYTTYYGNYESGSLYSHVKTFFDEGGSRCYVQRILTDDTGTPSAAGTLTLNDSSGSATMVATAKNHGDWSDNLDIEIVGADVSGFKVKVYLDDALLLATRDLTSVTDAINVVNSSAVSHLVELSDDDTSSSDPATAAATALSGGSDGLAVDDDDYATALATATTKITPNLGTGAICAPGKYGTTVWDALRDHAAANNRVALLSFNGTENFNSASDARGAAADYYADDKASYMAFYWPHIKVPSPNAAELASGQSTVAGSTVTISPEAFAAGARARAIQLSGGPWRPGAGQISQARTVAALAQDVTAATGETMDASRVNVLRKIGTGIRVYGARSVSNDEANWRYITMRDTMNYIVTGVEARMEEYVFETVDARGNLFGRIRGSIKAFLEPIRAAGGLYEAFDDDGVMIDPGFNVVVDSTLNPATQLANGLVKAQVGVRVSGVADLIDIVITKSNLSAPVI